jgi:hypothetical protein
VLVNTAASSTPTTTELTVTVRTRIDDQGWKSSARTFLLDKPGWKAVPVDTECEAFDIAWTCTDENNPGVTMWTIIHDQSDDVLGGRVAK